MNLRGISRNPNLIRIADFATISCFPINSFNKVLLWNSFCALTQVPVLLREFIGIADLSQEGTVVPWCSQCVTQMQDLGWYLGTRKYACFSTWKLCESCLSVQRVQIYVNESWNEFTKLYGERGFPRVFLVLGLLCHKKRHINQCISRCYMHTGQYIFIAMAWR